MNSPLGWVPNKLVIKSYNANSIMKTFDKFKKDAGIFMRYDNPQSNNYSSINPDEIIPNDASSIG